MIFADFFHMFIIVDILKLYQKGEKTLIVDFQWLLDEPEPW